MTTDQMNDHDKFVELYELYSHFLLKFAISIVKSPQLAEDLVQDSYVKIFKHISEIEAPTSARTRRYLVVTVRNTCYDYLDKMVSKVVLTDDHLVDYEISQDNPLDSAWDDFSTNEIRNKLRLFLETLSDSDRRLFEDAIIRGYRHRELAEKYGYTKTNVTVKIFRFRVRFRKFLENED